jgi:hypothetical protein
MPLAGSSIELARNIDEYRRADGESQKDQCIEGVLYCLAQYVRVQLGLVGTIPARDCKRPLGLFLSTKQSEDRVWDIMMPPWAFDMRGLIDQALLVDELYCPTRDSAEHSPHLRPTAEFIAFSRNPESNLGKLRLKLASFLHDSAHLEEMYTVLTAMGELVDYEVRRVLSAWYAVEKLEEPERLKEVALISAEVQAKVLGIRYPA